MLRPNNKKEEKVKLTKQSYQKAMVVFRYLKPYVFVYFVGWIFLVLSTFAGLFFPLLMGQLLGGVSNPVSSLQDSVQLINLSNINSVALLLFILFAIQALFSFFRVILFTNVTENALRDLRNDAFGKLIYMRMDFFNSTKVGELTSRVSGDIVQLQETLRTTIAEFFRQVVIVIGGLIFLKQFMMQRLNRGQSLKI